VIELLNNYLNEMEMKDFSHSNYSEEERREELIRAIEHSIARLTLSELEALYYDMTTKNYINEIP
jgi:hypothetical protein